MAMATALFPDRKRDDDTAHDIIELEVSTGTVRMVVVAIDAGLRDGEVGIDRLKEAELAFSDETVMRS